MLLAADVPLFPDETYYWDWSRHLAVGYFDHPFVIALLIRLGTAVLGATRLGVRAPIVLAGCGGSLAVAATARRLAGDRAALLAALVLTCMPLAAAGLLLATPDAPLLLAGALSVYFLVRALEEPGGSRAGWWWWVLAGLALGLGLDSKYTAVLIPLGALVALLAVRRLRPLLTRPEPWVAAAIALACFLPVVAWNARHGWVSFAFQLAHGLGSPHGRPLDHEGAMIGGQLGLVSPILFVMMVIAAVQALRGVRSAPPSRAGAPGPEGARALLAMIALVVPAFLMLTALRRYVQANWPAPAYVGAIAVLAAHRGGVRWRRWLAAGLALGGALVAVAYAQAVYPILPLPPLRDPVGRSFGYVRLADDVDRAARALARSDPGSRVWFAANNYHTASELAFHLEGRPQVFSVNLLSRPNQYDLWPRFPERARRGDTMIMVTGCDALPNPLVTVLATRFQRTDTLPRTIFRRDGRYAGEQCTTVLRGWDGTWPSRAQAAEEAAAAASKLPAVAAGG